MFRRSCTSAQSLQRCPSSYIYKAEHIHCMKARVEKVSVNNGSNVKITFSRGLINSCIVYIHVQRLKLFFRWKLYARSVLPPPPLKKNRPSLTEYNCKNTMRASLSCCLHNNMWQWNTTVTAKTRGYTCRCSYKLNGISILWVLCADHLHVRIVFFSIVHFRTGLRIESCIMTQTLLR